MKSHLRPPFTLNMGHSSCPDLGFDPQSCLTPTIPPEPPPLAIWTAHMHMYTYVCTPINTYACTRLLTHIYTYAFIGSVGFFFPVFPTYVYIFVCLFVVFCSFFNTYACVFGMHTSCQTPPASRKSSSTSNKGKMG